MKLYANDDQQQEPQEKKQRLDTEQVQYPPGVNSKNFPYIVNLIKFFSCSVSSIYFVQQFLNISHTQIKMAKMIEKKSTLVVCPSSLPIQRVIALLCYNILLREKNSNIFWVNETEEELFIIATFYKLYLKDRSIVRTVTSSNLSSFMLECCAEVNGIIFTTPNIVGILLQKRKVLFKSCVLLIYNEDLLATELKPTAALTCCRTVSNIFSAALRNIQTIVISRIPSVDMHGLAVVMSELGLSVRSIFQYVYNFCTAINL